MDEVAGEAELSKGTLYLYFANKDALCAALVERTLMRVRPHLEAIVSDARRSGRERLLAGLEAEAEFISAHPHLLRMMVGWMLAGLSLPEDDPALCAYRRAVGEVLRLAVRAITEGQQDGSIRKEFDPTLLAFQTWSGLIGALLLHTSRDDLARRFGRVLDTGAIVALYLAQTSRALAPHGVEGEQER